MNTKIEVTGTCAYVGEVQEFASGFQKRTFVLRDETEGKDGKTYTQQLAFDLKKEDVALVNESLRGKKLRVVGFVESRSWKMTSGEVKFFTDLVAKRVTEAVYMENPEPTLPPPAEPPTLTPKALAEAPEKAPADDLPF